MKVSQQTKNKAKFTFILLKLLEIGGAFGLTIGVYLFGKLYFYLGLGRIMEIENPETVVGIWGVGLLFILLIVAAFMVGFLIGVSAWAILKGFIVLNWKWAIILNETESERKVRLKEKKEKRRKAEEERQKNFKFKDGEKVRIKKGVTCRDPYYDKELKEKYWGKVMIIDYHVRDDKFRLIDNNRGGWSWYDYEVEKVNKKPSVSRTKENEK